MMFSILLFIFIIVPVTKAEPDFFELTCNQSARSSDCDHLQTFIDELSAFNSQQDYLQCAPAILQISPPPHGRLVPSNLSSINEDKLLRKDGRATLYAVGENLKDYHPEREPLILIHGIRADPKVFQSLVDRIIASPAASPAANRYQLYVLVYDDFGRRTSLNGVDLAEELMSLHPSESMTIVAHSMGGIVARQALNVLTSNQMNTNRRIRLYAADTPWHGFLGFSDQGAAKILSSLAAPILPDGLEDMRAKSAMFQGDPASDQAYAKQALLDVSLPENVSIDLSFSESGAQAHDYTEGNLKTIAQKIRDHYATGTTITGNVYLMNFWKAIRHSRNYPAFEATIQKKKERLTTQEVQDELEQHFPKFPGNHQGILDEHPNRRSYIDYLIEELVKQK